MTTICLPAFSSRLIMHCHSPTKNEGISRARFVILWCARSSLERFVKEVLVDGGLGARVRIRLLCLANCHGRPGPSGNRVGSRRIEAKIRRGFGEALTGTHLFQARTNPRLPGGYVGRRARPNILDWRRYRSFSRLVGLMLKVTPQLGGRIL